MKDRVTSTGKVLRFTGRSAYLAWALVLVLSIVVPSLFWPVPAEAAISARAGISTNAVTGQTAINFNIPAGTMDGDVLIAAVVTTGNPVITPQPAVWYSIGSITNGATMKMQIFLHRYNTGSNIGQFAFLCGGVSCAQNSSGGLAVYAGVDATSDTSAIDATGTGQFGNSTTATAAGVTTVNSGAMLVAAFGASAGGGGAPTTTVNSPLTARTSALASAAGLLSTPNTNVRNATGDELQGASGTVTGTRSATVNSAPWTAMLITLKPAPPSTFNQSAYRWFSNTDSADYIGITSNPTALDDKANATAVDNANGIIYTAGYDAGGASASSQWRIEKRSTTGGVLVSGTTAGGFTNGVITEDIASSAGEQINGIAIDVSADHMYVVGYDNVPGNTQWRIEKRKLSTGVLCTAAACGTAFGTNGILTNNPTVSDDQPKTIVIDASGGSMYVGGYENIGAGDNQWRTEKRSLSAGALVTAFDTDGIVNGVNFGNKIDEVTSMVLDVGNSVIYIAGIDGTPNGATKYQWRTEKRSMTTGALGTGFGGNGGCATGVYCNDITSGNDQINALAIDSTYLFMGGFFDAAAQVQDQHVRRITLSDNTELSISNFANSNGADELTRLYSDGTYLYVSGFSTPPTNLAARWTYNKFTLAGATVAGFGDGNSAIYSDPTSSDDKPKAMTVAGSHIYAVGFDGTGANQWRLEKRNTSDGLTALAPAAVAAQDTSYSATPNAVVRLRLLIHIGDYVLYPFANQQLKLQYAAKSGTCDTAYSGETSFTDITTSSAAIRYHDNPGPATGAVTSAITGDPVHSGHTNVIQNYQEANNFANPTTVIPAGQDGLWDFALTESGTAFGAYCLRVVDATTGNPLTTGGGGYTQVPEIKYCNRPTTAARLRHAKSFCDEQLRPFYWSVP